MRGWPSSDRPATGNPLFASKRVIGMVGRWLLRDGVSVFIFAALQARSPIRLVPGRHDARVLSRQRDRLVCLS